MRVLTIGNLWPPAGGGGYERIWASGVQALREAGHDVTVLTSDAPAPADDALRELRWYHRDGEWLRPSVLGAWAIERHNARVLDRELAGADAVVWWAMGGMSLSLIGRVARAGVPAVGIVGDGWMVYGPEVDRWPRRPRLQGAARWLFISAFVAQRSGFPGGEVLHPGVDPEAFPYSAPGEWRGRLAYVGRDDPRKGLETLRAAVALVEGATLATSAPGDAVGPLEAYREADAVVFPVEWDEPWGLVPLEAMSAGRPVIATGTGGSAEYLRDGVNCLLFPPGDAEALAAAVRRLAADPALRARLIEAGRATAADHSDRAFRAGIVAAVEAARPMP